MDLSRFGGFTDKRGTHICQKTLVKQMLTNVGPLHLLVTVIGGILATRVTMG